MNKDELGYYGVVYRITNLVDGKMYIGQTVKKRPKERFNQHIYEAKNPIRPVSFAIQESGRDSFVFQVCKVCSSKEELDIEEGKLIEKYKTYDEDYGYNLDRCIDGKKIRSESTISKLNTFVNSDKMIESSKNIGHKNRGKKRKVSSSKYMGVRKSKNSWDCGYSVNNKRISIGKFKDEKQAAMSVDIKLLENFGIDEPINFPELKDKYISGEITIKRPKGSRKEDIKFTGFKSR